MDRTVESVHDRNGVVSIPERPEETEGPADPERLNQRRGPPSEEQVRDEISQEIMRIHQESYGKGAIQAHTYLGNGYVVVVLDEPELLPNEKFLIESGQLATVVQVRSQYQQAIQTSFRAAIERATGRKVIGFASSTSFDEHHFVAEIFKLE